MLGVPLAYVYPSSIFKRQYQKSVCLSPRTDSFVNADRTITDILSIFTATLDDTLKKAWESYIFILPGEADLNYNTKISPTNYIYY